MGNTVNWLRPARNNNNAQYIEPINDQVDDDVERGLAQNGEGGDLYFGNTNILPSEDISTLLQGLRPTQSISQTVAVKSPVNLQKHTLRLLKSENNVHYSLHFKFDCTVPIKIKVRVGTENKTKETESPEINTQPRSRSFPAGLAQEYTTAEPFDLHNFTEQQIETPIIITLALPKSKDRKSNNKITKQTTIAAILQCSDGSFAAKVTEQSVVFAGISYRIHEIYGQILPNPNAREECVICMTDDRDTIVVPCRHMCLCHQCAEALRFQTNKCPICRGPVRSLLKIEVSRRKSGREGEDELSEEEEEEEHLLIKKKDKSKKKGKKEKSEEKKEETTAIQSP